MKTIKRVIKVEQRKNKLNGDFYLSTVLLDDGEIYSLAHHEPAKAGDEVLSWFDDRWQRPVAKYPKQLP